MFGYSSLFYALQGISTLFSLYWDLVMDFGLLQDTKDWKSFLLRDQLVVFPYKFIYYYVIIFNCLSRFTWIIASKHNNSGFINLACALIELLRRFHWTFLRIEYEHLNNCNLFRAVDDLKVPEVEGIQNRTADLFYKDMVSESKINGGDKVPEDTETDINDTV